MLFGSLLWYICSQGCKFFLKVIIIIIINNGWFLADKIKCCCAVLENIFVIVWPPEKLRQTNQGGRFDKNLQHTTGLKALRCFYLDPLPYLLKVWLKTPVPVCAGTDTQRNVRICISAHTSRVSVFDTVIEKLESKVQTLLTFFIPAPGKFLQSGCDFEIFC